MNIRQPRLTLLILFFVLGLSTLIVEHASAAQKKSPDKDSSPKILPLKPTKTLRPSAGETKLEIPRKPSLTAVEPGPPKRHRAVKAHKKVAPKAVVQPRRDLIHYGVLEDSRRYDPRPPTDSAAVRSPQTPELTHDHFQELDRNQDGVIDPVERAFGRIDMDRDLHTRTLH